MDEKLMPSQKCAYDAIMDGHNVFLTGHAGTGKSFLLRRVVTDLKDAGKNVVVAAPTGVAAMKAGGTTIHRLFSLIPDIYTYCPPCVPPILKHTDTLIIDEISMCRIDLLDYIGRVLQKAERPIQVVVVGDFCQLPPVMRLNEKAILVGQFGIDVGAGYQNCE